MCVCVQDGIAVASSEGWVGAAALARAQDIALSPYAAHTRARTHTQIADCVDVCQRCVAGVRGWRLGVCGRAGLGGARAARATVSVTTRRKRAVLVVKLTAAMIRRSGQKMCSGLGSVRFDAYRFDHFDLTASI